MASHPIGPWKEYENPCIGPGGETTFQSQGTFILPVKEKQGQYIFMADKWNKTDLQNSTYLLLHLYIRKDKVEIVK